MNRALLELRLAGIRLPATPAELLGWAREHEASTDELTALERLEERRYASVNDVGEALCPFEPAPVATPAHPGRTQSGEPPGGPEYGVKPDK